MTDTPPPLLSIVIPTVGRQSLNRTLGSCLQQQLQCNASFEIIVVDNTPDASLARQICAFGEDNRRILHLHEPIPGVSAARNSGVRAATGKYVAFLDDDEEARPGWAAALLRHAEKGAKAVFGPIEPVFEDCTSCPEALLMYARNPGYQDGENITRHRAYLGTGNSLFDRNACLNAPSPFPLELNRLGGEDSAFLLNLVDRGMHLTWASDAWVREHVAAERTHPDMMAVRRFRNGQVRSAVCFRSGGLRALQGFGWMAAGAAQFCAYGLTAMSLSRIDPPKALHYRLRAWGGAGKVLWGKSFWPLSCGALETPEHALRQRQGQRSELGRHPTSN
jgi:succinoglycan biosynthesis protein ExoM